MEHDVEATRDVAVERVIEVQAAAAADVERIAADARAALGPRPVAKHLVAVVPDLFDAVGGDVTLHEVSWQLRAGGDFGGERVPRRDPGRPGGKPSVMRRSFALSLAARTPVPTSTPVTMSVRSDAAATEIAQPVPSKVAS